MYSYKLLSLVRMLLLGRASVWLDPNCSACHLSEIYFDQGSGILHCCSQDEFVLALLLIITCKWMMFDFLAPSIPVNVVSEANTLFESCCQPIPLLNLFLTTKDLHSDSKNLRHLLPVFIHDWRRYRCLSNVDFFFLTHFPCRIVEPSSLAGLIDQNGGSEHHILHCIHCCRDNGQI